MINSRWRWRPSWKSRNIKHITSTGSTCEQELQNWLIWKVLGHLFIKSPKMLKKYSKTCHQGPLSYVFCFTIRRKHKNGRKSHIQAWLKCIHLCFHGLGNHFYYHFDHMFYPNSFLTLKETSLRSANPSPISIFYRCTDAKNTITHNAWYLQA